MTNRKIRLGTLAFVVITAAGCSSGPVRGNPTPQSLPTFTSQPAEPTETLQVTLPEVLAQDGQPADACLADQQMLGTPIILSSQDTGEELTHLQMYYSPSCQGAWLELKTTVPLTGYEIQIARIGRGCDMQTGVYTRIEPSLIRPGVTIRSGQIGYRPGDSLIGRLYPEDQIFVADTGCAVPPR